MKYFIFLFTFFSITTISYSQENNETELRKKLKENQQSWDSKKTELKTIKGKAFSRWYGFSANSSSSDISYLNSKINELQSIIDYALSFKSSQDQTCREWNRIDEEGDKIRNKLFGDNIYSNDYCDDYYETLDVMNSKLADLKNKKNRLSSNNPDLYSNDNELLNNSMSNTNETNQAQQVLNKNNEVNSTDNGINKNTSQNIQAKVKSQLANDDFEGASKTYAKAGDEIGAYASAGLGVANEIIKSGVFKSDPKAKEARKNRRDAKMRSFYIEQYYSEKLLKYIYGERSNMKRSNDLKVKVKSSFSLFGAKDANDGNYGYKKGRDWVIEAKYFPAFNFFNGKAVVRENGIWKIINLEGVEQEIPIEVKNINEDSLSNWIQENKLGSKWW